MKYFNSNIFQSGISLEMREISDSSAGINFVSKDGAKLEILSNFVYLIFLNKTEMIDGLNNKTLAHLFY